MWRRQQAMHVIALILAQSWPAPEAALRVLPVDRVQGVRIAIDAGHGAPGNTGNWGCHCQREADETLVEAHELARRLRRYGFEVLETRTAEAGARYQARIAAIERFKPQLVVSLHTDARAEAWPNEVAPDGGVCWKNSTDPGFSVLWSDEGSDTIVRARAAAGKLISRTLQRAGFLPYSGEDYGSLYRADAEAACFIDARPSSQRVYFLRATQVAPVLIIETHHALDPLEMARWHDAATHDAFAAAVANAAIDFVKRP